MRWVATFALTTAALAGCNQIFGIHQLSGDGSTSADDTMANDLDHDGVPDDLDPCIALAGEGAAQDRDGDGITDDQDPCPLDTGSADSDFDGIPDACDPKEMIGGDDVLCRMALTDEEIEGALWTGRSGEIGWQVAPGRLVSTAGADVSTAIVSETIEGSGDTTYEIDTTLETGGGDGSLTMWLRADPMGASSADFGCRVAVIGGGTRLIAIAPNGTSRTTNVNSPQSLAHVRLFGTYTIGSPMTVTCQLLLGGQFFVQTINSPPSTVGRFALSAQGWTATLTYLEVFNHPTAP